MISKVNLRRTLIAALVAEICIPALVMAQSNVAEKKTKEDAETTSVTVTGIRASLASSLATKRIQEGVVDVVSAEDVGKFPDTNIAESLQRVTGVQIQRENGEGRFISVRGLGPEFNNVLFNGRTLSSDNLGRQFSFDLLSSDLISKTLVYKSSLPGLPEGGIGSTVDIQTARPLSIGTKGSINGSAAYDSMSKKVTSNVGGMYSWANAEKNFGVLGTFSWTDRASLQNTMINDNWSYKDVPIINGTDSSKGLTASDVVTKKLYAPRSLGFQQEDERRRRIVGNITMQFNPTKDWKLTGDALYSRLIQDNNIVALSDWIENFVGTEIDAKGQIKKFTRPGTDFWANNPELFGPGKKFTAINANDMIAKRDNRRSVTNAYGLNSVYQVNPDIKVVTDLSTSRTASESPSMWIVNGFKPAKSDTLTFGNIPSLQFGNSVIDPAQVWAHSGYIGVSFGKDEVREARTTVSWVKEIGAFKGIDAGLGLQTRHVHYFYYENDSWGAYTGYKVKLPASLFTLKSYGDFLDGQAPPGYLSYNPYQYMNLYAQPAMIAQSNDPARYSDLNRYPNGFTAINYSNPRFWSVDERVKNLFFDTKWEGKGWSANAGLRYVSVGTQSINRAQALQSVTIDPKDSTSYLLTYGPNVTQYADNSYSSLLPSANLKYDITPDMLLRLGVSKTETRPTLNELGVTNSYGRRVGNVTSGGGNPYLKPMKATNFDVSYEWYLSKTDYVSLAAYHKKVSNFLEKFTTDITVPLFPGEVVHDTRTRNTQTGKISGAEIAGQFMLDKVHPWLKNTGVTANFTYVKASAERAPGTIDCGYPGLSPKSFNASVFYEDSRFSARLSYNKRDAYVINCGSGVVLPVTRAAFGQADASLRYNLTDSIQLYADIINLNNARSQEYSLDESMFLNLKDQGRRIHAGARLKF